MNKLIYIKPENKIIFEKAKKLSGKSMSETIAIALKLYLRVKGEGLKC